MAKFHCNPTSFVYSSFVSLIPSRIFSRMMQHLGYISQCFVATLVEDKNFTKLFQALLSGKDLQMLSSAPLPLSLHARLEQGNPLCCSFPFTLFTLNFSSSLFLYFLSLSCPLRGKLGLTDPDPRPALTYRPHPTISSTVKWPVCRILFDFAVRTLHSRSYKAPLPCSIC